MKISACVKSGTGLLLILVVGCGLDALPRARQAKRASNPTDARKAADPMSHTHSHNDYNREHPLTDALEHGFHSVEADIFLQDGVCVVAHDREDIRAERTLDAMYLAPLWQRYQTNGSDDGHIVLGCDELLLLVDLKEDGDPILKTLAYELEPYRRMLTRIEDGRLVKSRVLVCLTGERPVEQLRQDEDRLLFLDGRPYETVGERRLPRTLAPLVSDSIKNYLLNASEAKKKGKIELANVDAEKIRAAVAWCCEYDQRFRLWGYPDDPAFWSLLLDLGVDLINTDAPARLHDFLVHR